jgi:DNA (cytosine-5)-methyltransferase 1
MVGSSLPVRQRTADDGGHLMATTATSLVFGSLFTGAGGLDLGLEQAGHKCSWQVEADDYCKSVLSRHWPSIPKFDDVREVGAKNLAKVDLICGGFPCQDVSSAGRRAGIQAGTRSGLWYEFHRIICELRPRFVLVENVEALRHKQRGLGRVLGDLAESGYDAEWDCLSASAFGAPHLRERLFIFAWDRSVSHSRRLGRPDAVRQTLFAGVPRKEFAGWLSEDMLEPTPIIGLSYPGIPRHLRMVDGIPGRMDAADLSPKQRREIVKSVPWAAQRVKACGNAVAVPVAAHVGRSISHWLN